MRIAVLQHVPFEGPAAIADWAAKRGASLSTTHLYRGEGLPLLHDFDMLTVMGGPMSANDEMELDWLGLEIALIGEAVASNKVILGICLGSQLIAKALGARVYPASEKEIGWLPVRQIAAQNSSLAGLPETFTPFHWHGDTFDLPRNAKRLAETDAVPNQAFAVGERVLGLQFHMEATHGSVWDLLNTSSHEIGHGPYEQPPGAIVAGIDRHCATIRPLLEMVLDRLTGLSPQGR